MIQWHVGGRVYPQLKAIGGFFTRLAKNLYVPPVVVVETFEGISWIVSKKIACSALSFTFSDDSDMISVFRRPTYIWTEFNDGSELI